MLFASTALGSCRIQFEELGLRSRHRAGGFDVQLAVFVFAALACVGCEVLIVYRITSYRIVSYRVVFGLSKRDGCW